MAMSAYYLKGIAPGHMTLVQIFNGSTPENLLEDILLLRDEMANMTVEQFRDFLDNVDPEDF